MSSHQANPRDDLLCSRRGNLRGSAHPQNPPVTDRGGIHLVSYLVSLIYDAIRVKQLANLLLLPNNRVEGPQGRAEVIF
jgi:hypothetical protein